MNLHTAGLIARGIFVVVGYAALTRNARREREPIAVSAFEQRMMDMAKAVGQVVLFFVAFSMVVELGTFVLSSLHGK
ncbi:hypothetical protein [Burkholderia sp. BCC1972]|uniref:hypothetical protein n=1 Tax=Burkholderia sp. BCC1972 TaxID=2817438 RepID=UPI002ABE0AFD|nr:hypothetical protein [Burkholderia sp. BCC1972]